VQAHECSSMKYRRHRRPKDSVELVEEEVER
jgi:hypothetical protein